MYVISINNLTKKYHRKVVFSNFSLTIKAGDAVFLVGNNGSGKTTFLKCLLNLIKYQGEIDDQRVSYSYCPEKLVLPDYLTLRDFLVLMGKVKKVAVDEKTLWAKLAYYLHRFKLEEHLDKYLIKLSQGTRQKVLIILTLIVDAEVYLFDEPLNGLDQNSRLVFYEELKRLHQNNKTIIISTHHLASFRFPEKVIVNFNRL